MLKYVISLIAVVFTLQAHAQTLPEIRAQDLQVYVKYLASPALEGRASGTEGNRKAAAYIADWMKRAGLEPKGDNGTYYQTFDFVAAVRLGKNNHAALSSRVFPSGTRDLRVNDDFRPFGFSTSEKASGGLVLAGYGISAPDQNYDDYAGVDVNGKIVVVLRHGPDGTDPHSPFNKYTSFRNKARVARDKGAAAIVIINGPRDEQSDDLMKLTSDQSFESSGIPVLSMKRDLVDSMLAAQGMTLGALQDSIRSSKAPHSIPMDAQMTLETDVIKVKAKTANLVGYLPGNDPLLRTQVLILGAHMDHLGYGGPGSGSLMPDTLAVHPGADDNASGSAGLMELMQWLSFHKASLRRSVLILFFSGEELGTLGSAYYVSHPTVPLGDCVAMINMDMVGRLVGKNLTVYGTGTSPAWPPLLERMNKDSVFALKTIPDGYGPSDHSQFYGKDMPVLFFFTGTHNDYHKPTDTWDKINYTGEEKVVRFVGAIADAVDIMPERPAFTKVKASTPSPSGDARSFSVTLGVIPDYAGEAQGMKIGGIRPNGPAEKAGLQAGDVIVKMAGKTIMNIYDYMGVLGELKEGDNVEIEAMRNGKVQQFHAVMTKRK